ncbi:MAG: type IX secretion system membrane protein PorP/SprF [Sporocytophaga sp.]|uniref:PorP/SprF family type IX secretion system membrane protein n=1 Tax=Sporocytophaga sp. TaxID=2231183 RepID=UPI001B165B47|nr:type IX secretion system membrane protein PorP/SprF [Sporocytophaga sp.]MBO9700917.1 type IX secretion system membrane protein PorP/SprF [Sporocytophaga sp.]
MNYSRSLNKAMWILILFCSIRFSYAQDIQFSQFYANVLYLNPAFAGSAHSVRAIAHQRLQWPGLEARYTTSCVSIDNFFNRTGGGLGLMFLKDWQGTKRISSTEIRMQYAQEINLSPKLSARAGAEINYINRYLNYSYLTFPDQFNDDGFTNTQTKEPFGATQKGFFDMGVGTMLYSEYFWVGFSAHHVNTPDQSFYGNGSDLPAKFALIAGYKFMLEKGKTKGDIPSDEDVYVTPTIHYKSQGKSDQLDLGVYGLYHRLLLGGWYRGIPLLKHYRVGIQNNESVVLLIGYKVHPISISYSYDCTVSDLTRAGTRGAHELNITYVYHWPPKRRKPYRKLPCPTFKGS